MPKTLDHQLQPLPGFTEVFSHVVDVAETTRFCLFGVMQSACPVDRNVCRTSIQLLRRGCSMYQRGSRAAPLGDAHLYYRQQRLSRTRRHPRMVDNHHP